MDMDCDRMQLRGLARASAWAPVLALGLCLGFAADSHAQLTIPGLGIFVTANRNQKEAFSDAQVDQALQRAGAALSFGDGPGDFMCGQLFVRNGTTSVFSGPNDVGTEADLLTVFALPGLVKVVDDLDICDAERDVNILGCSDGSSVVLEDVADNRVGGQFKDLDGILWAHEIGHTVGLFDRPDTGFVMSGQLTPASLFVTPDECSHYQAADNINKFNGFNPNSPAVGIPGIAPEAARESSQPVQPIEELVKGRYIDAMPIDAILRYGAADLPALVPMLSDRAAMDAWPMATTVLGMLGDDATANSLIEFIEAERQGPIARGEYSAIRSAIQSLAFLANRANSSVALDYLMAASKPEFWANRPGMRWTSKPTPSPEQRDRKLATDAVFALGLSGSPQAMAMLQNLWSETDRASADVSERTGTLRMLEHAMSDNAKISRIGLAEYYRH